MDARVGVMFRELWLKSKGFQVGDGIVLYYIATKILILSLKVECHKKWAAARSSHLESFMSFIEGGSNKQ